MQWTSSSLLKREFGTNEVLLLLRAYELACDVTIVLKYEKTSREAIVVCPSIKPAFVRFFTHKEQRILNFPILLQFNIK